MYKSEDDHRKAAKGPEERNMPFGKQPNFQNGKPAKNDPVGTQVYTCDAYGKSQRINWVDRS